MKKTDPTCGMPIAKCVEAGSHHPACTCILPPEHEEPCESAYPEIKPMPRPQPRVYLIARDHQDGMGWIRHDSGIMSNPRRVIILATESSARGIGPDAIIFRTERAHEGRQYFEITRALKLGGSI